MAVPEQRETFLETVHIQQLFTECRLFYLMWRAAWHGGLEYWPWSQTTWGCTQTLPLTSFVTFSKLLNVSRLQFHRLQIRDRNNIYVTGWHED